MFEYQIIKKFTIVKLLDLNHPNPGPYSSQCKLSVHNLDMLFFLLDP